MRWRFGVLAFLNILSAGHARSETPADWETYFTRADDVPYSLLVDVGLLDVAPLAQSPQLISVVLRLQQPNQPDDGLPSPSERSELARIEDALKSVITSECRARYIARRTGGGGFWMYFYGSCCQRLETVVGDTMRQFSPYRFRAEQISEPSWTTYIDNLHPGTHGMRLILNGRMFDEFEKRGENNGEAREMDHTAFFKSAESRKRFIEEIAKKSFAITHQERVPDARSFTFAVHFLRKDPLRREVMNEVTLQLEDLAAKHGGIYDGWAALAEPKR